MIPASKFGQAADESEALELSEEEKQIEEKLKVFEYILFSQESCTNFVLTTVSFCLLIRLSGLVFLPIRTLIAAQISSEQELDQWTLLGKQ